MKRTPWALVLSGLLLAAGCSDDGSSPPGTDSGPPQGDAKTTPGAKGNGEFTGLTEASKGVFTPFDATPDPTGRTVYYTALITETEDLGKKLVGALFKADGQGGTPTQLAKGFVTPLQVISSTDGKTIFVADTGHVTAKADDAPDAHAAGGAIYAVPSTGGAQKQLTGTPGYRPRGLDLVAENNSDVIYFSGNNLKDGKAGVYKVGAPTGGNVTMIVEGAPLDDPSGVAVTAAGTIYVADTSSGGTAGSQIIVVEKGKASVLVSSVRVGYPAGIALSQDDKYLMVSGLATDANSAVIYRIELATKKIVEFSSGISQNTESAGVHRAHKADRFAWANASAPDADGKGGGTVYLIGTKSDPLKKK